MRNYFDAASGGPLTPLVADDLGDASEFSTSLQQALIATGTATWTATVAGSELSLTGVDADSALSLSIALPLRVGSDLAEDEIYLVGFNAYCPFGTSLQFALSNAKPLDSGMYPPTGSVFPDRSSAEFCFAVFRAPAAGTDVRLDFTFHSVGAIFGGRPPTITLSAAVLYRLWPHAAFVRVRTGSLRSKPKGNWQPMEPSVLYRRAIDSDAPLLASPWKLDLAIAPPQAGGQNTLGGFPNGASPIYFAGNSRPFYSDQRAVPVYVFPYAGSDDYAFVQLVALCEFYGYPLTRVLWLDEYMHFDAQALRARLQPGAVPRTYTWWMADWYADRLNRTSLGGDADGLDLKPHFDLYRNIGANGVSTASPIGIERQAVARGIRQFSFELAWYDALVLQGARKADGGVLNLFKRPDQPAEQALRTVVRDFLEHNAGLADFHGNVNQPLYIASGELNDTHAGYVYALRSARAELEEIAQHYRPIAGSDTSMTEDIAYTGGFANFLALDAALLQTYYRARNKSISAGPPAATPQLGALLNRITFLPPVHTALVQSAPSPGNGGYDVTFFDHVVKPGDADPAPVPLNRSIAQRRPPLLAETAGDDELVVNALWYEQARYWNHANISLLKSLDGLMRAGMGAVPHVHYASLSRMATYLLGFEPYQVCQAGIFNMILLDDTSTRYLSALWAAPCGQLLHSNLLADYGRALVTSPQGAESANQLPMKLGAYVHADAADLKALVWASRGATHFSLYQWGPNPIVDPDHMAWGNAGELAQLFLQQTADATRILSSAEGSLYQADREPARIAMMVPQTDGIWMRDDRVDLVIDDDDAGMHALFTHHHLAVDWVFEEALARSPFPLTSGGYRLLYINAVCMRDDVFCEVARWVEQDGGQVVFGYKAATHNEFGWRITARDDWKTYWIGLGRVCLLDSAVGRGYHDSMRLLDASLLLFPLPAMTRAYRDQWMGQIETQLGIAFGGGGWRSCRVESVVTEGPADPGFIELVRHRQTGRSDALFVFNYHNMVQHELGGGVTQIVIEIDGFFGAPEVWSHASQRRIAGTLMGGTARFVLELSQYDILTWPVAS